MKKEYDLSKMKRIKKGPIVSKSKTKISKTIRLDFAVVEWLLLEADRRGVKYQSLINSLLKEAMEAGGSILNETKVRQIVREELKKRVS